MKKPGFSAIAIHILLLYRPGKKQSAYTEGGLAIIYPFKPAPTRLVMKSVNGSIDNEW